MNGVMIAPESANHAKRMHALHIYFVAEWKPAVAVTPELAPCPLFVQIMALDCALQHNCNVSKQNCA
jgi:hypothetical protein